MKHSLSICICLAAVLAIGFIPSRLRAEELFDLDIEKFELGNGMRVILLEDHRSPNVVISLTFHSGSACEKPGQTGYAHLFEHMMFQGLATMEGDFTSQMKAFGADAGGTTSEDLTRYFDFVPSNYLERALWLESNRLANIAQSIRPDRLEVQKDVVINERRQHLDNQPYSRMEEARLSALYPPDHPYSWEVVGHIEDLLAADTAALIEFSRSYYSPNNTALILVGDFDRANARAMIETYFAPIPAGPPVERPVRWIPAVHETKRVVVQDKVSLPKLYIQWPSPPMFAEGDAEASILGQCLGSGVTSRLYRALVDEQGLAVGVEAYQYPKELAGEFVIEVTAHPGGELAEIERAVDAVLFEVIEHGLSEAEVEAAKSKIMMRRVGQLQSTYVMAARLGLYEALLDNPDRFEWDAERLRNVTAKSVQEFARRYLNPKRRVVLECVPFGELVASGEMPDWAAAPEGGAEREFTPPRVEEEILENGMRLLVVERHDLPLFSLDVLIHSGRSFDPAGRWGLATMVQALIDEGTKTRSMQEIAQEFDELGTTASTRATADRISVSVNGMRESFDPALEVLADIIMNSTFPESELEKKKGRFVSYIGNYEFDPDVTAINVLNHELYGEESPFAQPAGGLGTEESIAAMTREDLIAYYERHFRPDNATAIVVGDLTTDEAKQKIERAFRPWKPTGEGRATVRATPVIAGRRILLVDQPEATQSVVCLGQSSVAATDSNYVAGEMLCSALMSYETAGRINKEVREERGYSYGLAVELRPRQEDGIMLVMGKVETDHTAEAIQLVLQAMDEIAAEKQVSEKELATVTKTEVQRYSTMFEMNSDVAEMLVKLLDRGLPLNRLYSYSEEVKALTCEDITRAARECLHPEEVVIVVIGDRIKIEQPLRDLGLGEVSVVEAGAF